MSSTILQPASPPSSVASTITPRAEFRVFGPHVAEAVRGRLWNGRTVLGHRRLMPTEIYLVSREAEHATVKIREGLLDIKVRIGLTSHGYAIFQPQAKFAIPVTADELRKTFAVLRVSAPLDRSRYSESEIVALSRRLRLAVVAVDKTRWGFTIDGVLCECAQVYFNGAMVESVCVESERYEAMPDVIDALGLAGAKNTSYASEALRIVGLT